MPRKLSRRLLLTAAPAIVLLLSLLLTAAPNCCLVLAAWPSGCYLLLATCRPYCLNGYPNYPNCRDIKTDRYASFDLIFTTQHAAIGMISACMGEVLI